ncbi:MAG TPA: efflux RND transporter periplasmic adaptor subunit [Candidatus Polarisedimenticolaceae bacterium]|nr:efflux RND transporter periplasmic adaptor subunit [Candidatus Polarisedimenticolaceae bacterium]
MKTDVRIPVALLAVMIATAVAVGCGGSGKADASDGEVQAETATHDDESAGEQDGEGDDKKNKKEEAIPVEVAELELGSIETVLSFSSNLEAEEQVKVYSEAKRLITELLVEEGDRVAKGRVLLRLQDGEQLSALAKAGSQLDQARREYEQQHRLFTQELISEQAYNDAKYELDQLQIAYDDAKRELGYTEVQAPIAGTVTARLVNLGDQVQIGQHLFDIVDFDSIVARIYVPEKYLTELRPGLAARLAAQTSETQAYSGTVDRISPIVDPKSGTIKVTVEVGNQPGLRPGMYVDVDLVVAQRDDAVLVPKRAVVYDNDQMFVYRVDGEQRARRIFIEAALSDKYFVQPREGLSSGDRVVVAGQAGLKDGALVKLPEGTQPDQTLEAAEDPSEVIERASR